MFGGKTSDSGLVTSMALPNAFILYINNGGLIRWKHQLPAISYDSVQHLSFFDGYDKIAIALKPFAIVTFRSSTGFLHRHFYETGVTVPGSVTVNSFYVEGGSDNIHLAMQTGDFRWQYIKMSLTDSFSWMGSLSPKLVFRSTLSPSGALKVHDADGSYNKMFITGILNNKIEGKVYSTLTKITSDN